MRAAGAAFALAGLLSMATARGNELTQELPVMLGSMARFAQPVRVGDLVARDLLRPEYEQTVLGYVAPPGVVRTVDNQLFLVVDWGGLWGIGATRVVVPLDDTALLGEHVVFVHVPISKLATLRRFDAGAFVALPADQKIGMMIVGPFH